MQSKSILYIIFACGIIVAFMSVIVAWVIWQFLPENRAPLSVLIPVDENANWQTYKSEEYGFEIKYPSSYDLSTCKECSDKVNITTGGNGFFMEVGIDIWKTDKGSYKNVSLQNWIDETRKRIENANHEYLEEGIVSVDNNYKYAEEIIEIDGILATKIVDEGPDLTGTSQGCCGYGGPGQHIIIFVENKGLKYEISGWIDKNDVQAYIPVLDQILSTFKFINN